MLVGGGGGGYRGSLLSGQVSLNVVVERGPRPKKKKKLREFLQ